MIEGLGFRFKVEGLGTGVLRFKAEGLGAEGLRVFRD